MRDTPTRRSMPSLGLSDALSQTDVAVMRETECRRLLDIRRGLEVAVSSRRYERGRTIYGRGEDESGLYFIMEGAAGLFGGVHRSFGRQEGGGEAGGALGALRASSLRRAFEVELGGGVHRLRGG